ncbi:unnamed protein product [Caenorhabditis angaria]|uniref:Serpentine Receptor, class H n=1 Tax=Caenorhabditis angaria TaxID=860376 RepID=A0A9P1IL77_9PELO|nr:unnamed protein product [Caenorhabditis angaria]
MCYDSNSILNSPKTVPKVFWTITILSIFIHIFGAFCILQKTPKSVKSVRFWLFNFHLWSLLLDFVLGFAITPFFFLPTLTFRAFGFLEGFERIVPYLVVLVLAGTGYSLVFLLENRYNCLKILEFSKWRKTFRVIFYVANTVFLFAFPLISVVYVPDQKLGRIQAIQLLPCLAEIPDFFVVVTDKTQVKNIVLVIFLTVFIIVFQSIFFAWSIIRISDFSKNISKHTIALQRKFIKSILIQKLIPSASLLPPIFYIFLCIFTTFHWQKLTNLSIFLVNLHGIIGSAAMLFLHKTYKNTVIDLVYCRRQINGTPMEVNNYWVKSLPS